MADPQRDAVTCRHCGKTFDSMTKLKEHEQRQHRDKEIEENESSENDTEESLGSIGPRRTNP